MIEVHDQITESRPQRFRRYPAYEDSGVEWLGKVPAHWSLKRLKNAVARLESGGTPESGNLAYWTDEEDGIPWVAISDMTRSFRVRVTAKRITEEGRRSKRLRILPAGTLLYSMYASLGRVALLETQGVMNQAILGVVPRESEVLRDYLRWWLEFMQAHVQMLSASNTQDNLSAARVRNMPVVLPIAVEEQLAIAAFLDRETAKIDGLVERKERLIELLQEKRTALITRAVTRGLDPDVPMKDSDVEWLGEIPAHWEVKRLKHVSIVENSGAYGSEPGEGAVDLPVCTTAHLTVDGLFLVDDMPVRGLSVSEVDRYVGIPGDIFVVKSSGSNTNIISGKLGLVSNATPRIVFGNFLLRIRPSARAVCPKFLAYLLRSELTRERIRRMVATTTYPNIDVPEYVASALALPSVDEQKGIATFLDSETARIDILIAKIRQAIDLLKEFRTALISAAVTGKIDIREEAA